MVIFSCKEEKNPLKRDKSFIPKELEKYVTGVVEYKQIKKNIELINV